MKKATRLSEECIKQISSISPTKFLNIKLCPLREMWISGGKDPQLPMAPKARVGTVIHQLISEAGHGVLLPEYSAIDKRWAEKINEVQTTMSMSPIEKQLVPLERVVYDLEVSRIRAVIIALKIAKERNKRSDIVRTRSTLPGVGFELHVR